MAHSLRKRIGARLHTLRKSCGLSQADMVRSHGFSLSHYQKLERGVSDPRVSSLARCANAFKVSLAELLDGV